VEFKLTYQGRLPAASPSSTRNKEKHEIRKVLHRQLKELWQSEERLHRWLTQKDRNNPRAKTQVDMWADRYAKLGYRWMPLITEMFSTGCELDILSSAGGDLDNRLKVLFDSLRMPQYDQELAGFSAGSGEDPFFVLLEDDSLISKIIVSTDRLLTPLKEQESINDVHLIIGVRVKVFTVHGGLDNLMFL